MYDKVEEVRKVYVQRFGGQPLVVRAPGRVNIIGEHIDYNDGLVLPMAIDRYIYMAIGISDSSTSLVHSLDTDSAVEFEDLSSVDFRGWKGYVLGVLNEFKIRYNLSTAVHIVFTGDIPQGSGLSSSAALEVATATALQSLFALDIPPLELALLCQQVEHQYVGTQCGLMDQYASVFGQKDAALLLDCKTNTHQQIELKLNNYQFILFNSGVHHALAESAYNDRRANCESGLAIIRQEYGVQSFRDVTLGMIDTLRERLTDSMRQQCAFVVHEIQRVMEAVKHIKSENWSKLGSLLLQSHHGLSKEYQVSCPELDYLVDTVQALPSVLGARMMGGGFGGCTINLILDTSLHDIHHIVRSSYMARFGIDPLCITVQGGTRLVGL